VRKSLWIALAILFVSAFSSVYAYDVIDEKQSYIDSKYITLGVGLGFTGFSMDEGISGDTGFGFRVTAGHHFNKYFQAEIGYQFSTFLFSSPDPIAPSTQLRTRADMNQEWIRLVATYPAVLLQPYVSAGIGGYNLFGVNKETALSFPSEFQIPVSAGVRAYIYKNKVSFEVEYSYQFLFGEGQSADTLALLNINEVSFNTTSVIFSVTCHFL
jgi:hypothetical protein